MTSGAQTTNPYHEARSIWNERYQNLVRARWNWQLIALVLALPVGVLFEGLFLRALGRVPFGSISRHDPAYVRVALKGEGYSGIVAPAQ